MPHRTSINNGGERSGPLWDDRASHLCGVIGDATCRSRKAGITERDTLLGYGGSLHEDRTTEPNTATAGQEGKYRSR